ncbi:MAG: hypothetical protein ACRCYP_03350 [Alphaproteobacteria bacterium]
MRQILILTLTVLLLFIPQKAFADNNIPDLNSYRGAWSVNEKYDIWVFRNSKKYAIDLYDHKTRARLDSVTPSVPIGHDDVLGRFDCYRKSVGIPDLNIAVLTVDNVPSKAWAVRDGKFMTVNAKNVVCEPPDGHNH